MTTDAARDWAEQHQLDQPDAAPAVRWLADQVDALTTELARVSTTEGTRRLLAELTDAGNVIDLAHAALRRAGHGDLTASLADLIDRLTAERDQARRQRDYATTRLTHALAETQTELEQLQAAVEQCAAGYEQIDGGTENVKVYAADVAAKIRSAIEPPPARPAEGHRGDDTATEAHGAAEAVVGCCYLCQMGDPHDAHQTAAQWFGLPGHDPDAARLAAAEQAEG